MKSLIARWPLDWFGPRWYGVAMNTLVLVTLLLAIALVVEIVSR